MLRYKVKDKKRLIMIGKVFAKYGINLLYGESGCGKTISAIKALNNDNVIPILLDFDDNLSPEENNCQFIHLNGIDVLKDKDIDIPKEQVIVIDTWQLFLTNGGTLSFIKKLIEAKNTVIIIAHNKAIATKQDIPDIDPKLSNHFASKLFLERKFVKGKPVYTLYVLKLRGYKDNPVIKNWMRETEEINESSK
jgi:hypothetical protein